MGVGGGAGSLVDLAPLQHVAAGQYVGAEVLVGDSQVAELERLEALNDSSRPASPSTHGAA